VTAQASRCVVCGAENTVFPGHRSAKTGAISPGRPEVTMRYPDGPVASACASHSDDEAATGAVLAMPFLVRSDA
jgi:hypothetical protein